MSDAFLVLVRHGNTFETGQTATWVGARTDLPLTVDGEKQAHAAAAYIKNKVDSISGVCAGPLKRTVRFAEIISEYLQKDFAIDERLKEIDYGKWEGLSGEEIERLFGAEVLEKWEKQGVWPENMEWSPCLQDLHNTLKKFLAEQHKKNTCQVCVTSNGILRVVHELVTGRKSGAEAKVKTGHICVLVSEKSGWRLVEWNKKPDQDL